jgi:hypothetical protein
MIAKAICNLGLVIVLNLKYIAVYYFIKWLSIVSDIKMEEYCEKFAETDKNN